MDATTKGTLDAEVVVVVSNRAGAGGLDRASSQGIPTLTIESNGFSSRALFESALADELVQYQPDLIALAGFMHVLGPAFIHSFNERIVNIHPSLLPRFRGLNTHRRALQSGASQHGATVHFVTPELDDGEECGTSRGRTRRPCFS